MELQVPDEGWRNVWRIAGSIPIDPRPMTLRQLVWMTEGRDRHVWSVASAMMSLIANCHGDGKTEYEPDDFNPTLTKEERNRNATVITDENVELMRNEFKLMFSES